MSRFRFRIAIALVGIPLLVVLADMAWSQGPDFQSKGSYARYQYKETYYVEVMGSFGSYYTSVGSRSANVYVSKVEGMSSFGPYDAYQITFDVNVSTMYDESGYAYASGTIPESLISFDNPKNHNLTLNVDTADPALGLYKYQYGNILLEYPEINLRWDRANNNWYRWQGHRMENYGDYVVHSRGNGTEYWAEIAGEIMPLFEPTFPDPSAVTSQIYIEAWLGDQQSVDRVIYIGP